MRDEWEERNFSSDTDILVRREYKNVAASLCAKKIINFIWLQFGSLSQPEGNFHTDSFRDMKDTYFI